jgi:hypothetical protein
MTQTAVKRVTLSACDGTVAEPRLARSAKADRKVEQAISAMLNNTPSNRMVIPRALNLKEV